MIDVTQEIEQRLRTCFHALSSVCDGAVTRDDLGFNGGEAKSWEIKALLAHTGPYNAEQLERIYSVVTLHKTQLTRQGYSVPDKEQVRAFIKLRHAEWDEIERKEREAKAEAERKKREEQPWLSNFYVDFHDNALWLRFPLHLLGPWRQIKDEYYQRFKRGEEGFADYPRWTDNERKEWYIEYAWQGADYLFSAMQDVKLSPAAQELKDKIQFQKGLDAAKKAQDATVKMLREKEERKEYMQLLRVLDLDKEIAPGIKLYEHQKIGIQFMLSGNRRKIVGDDTGLGKTLEGLVAAKILHIRYDYRIIIVTTASVQYDWKRAAAQLELPVEVYTWDKQPEPDDYWEDYVAIYDESHKAQNLTTARTKNMMKVALHVKCKALYHLTGTPMRNDRPNNIYPLLLTCKHPLVWHDDPKKRRELQIQYQNKYCDRHQVSIRNNTFWDVSGCMDLIGLRKQTVYVHGSDSNHPAACLITRRKIDCLDMPEKQRIPRPCSVSPTAIRRFAKDVAEAMGRFDENTKASIADLPRQAEELVDQKRAEIIKEVKIDIAADKFKPEEYDVLVDFRIKKIKDTFIDQKTAEIEGSAVMVSFGAFCQAADRAKIEEAVELADQILAEGNKVVLFTKYTGVAEDLAAAIRKESKVEVGIIAGNVSDKKRDELKQDFQNEHGTIKCMICTAAGGEGITLTAASYMIMFGRPWTPGDVQQWEDRIWRIGQKNACDIYWLSLPERITDVDGKIDEIIQRKARNINTYMHGEQVGFKFVGDIQHEAESIMRNAMKKIQRYLA